MQNKFLSKSVPRGTRTIWRYLGALFLLFTFAIGNVMADTYADVYTNPASGSGLAGNANGKGAFSVITCGDGTSFGNSALQIGTSGGSGSFTVASIDGSYITSIAFTSQSSYPINTLTSEDGEIVESEGVYTFTPSSATLTSATFSMTAKSGKKVRVAPITVNLTSDHSYLSMNFSVSSGKVSCTKSSGAADLAVTTTGSASSNRLSFGSGKTLTFTSEEHNIAAIHFTCVSHANLASVTASSGTVSGSSWAPDSDVKTVTFTSGNSNTIGAISVKLTAAAPATNYTITYDANGGSGTMENSTNNVADCGFTYEGKDFAGWKDGEGNDYEVGGTVNKNVTLYAQWVDHVARYTLIYKVDGVEKGREIVNVVGGTPEGITAPTKDCYTFAGWSPALTDVTGTDGAEVETNATWTPKYASSINLAKMVTDGTTSDIATILSGANYVQTDIAGEWGKTTEDVAYQGYKIKKADWALKFLVKAGKQVKMDFGSIADKCTIKKGSAAAEDIAANKGDGKSYSLSFTAAQDMVVEFKTTAKNTVTLYRISINDLFSATYTDEKGDASGNASNVTEVTLPTPSATTVGGYSFIGWVANQTVYDGETPKTAGEALNAGGTYTLTATTAFTAQWVQLYAVTYDNNGGEGIMTDSNSPYAEGAEVTLLANAFTEPENKVFGSWVATYNDGEVKTLTITDGKFTMPAFPVTVTAQWVDDNKVAKIGDNYYESLVAAVAAAQDNDVIYLLKNAQGGGLKINKSITIDFGGFTYSVGDPAVGSTGTETLAVQLLAGNNITFQNGTLDVYSGATCNIYRLIQNYSNLTLTNMTLDGTKITYSNPVYAWTLTTCNGTVTLGENTHIIAKAGGSALYVCAASYNAYPNGTQVTMGNKVTIDGNIQYGKWTATSTITDASATTLTITGGTVNGEFILNTTGEDLAAAANATINVSGGVFNHPVPEAYCADGYAPKDNGNNTYGVKPLATSIDFEALADTHGTGTTDVRSELEAKNYTFSGSISANNGASWDAATAAKPADKGLKIKGANGTTLSFDVAAGKLVTLKVGSLKGGATIAVNGGTAEELTGSNPLSTGASVYTYYYSADVATYSIAITGTDYDVIQSVTIEDPYVVTFNANGGEDVTAMEFHGTALTLPSATKESEVFKGWYDAAEGGNLIGKANESYTPTADVTLYAQWEAVSSDATLSALEVDGATVAGFDPETYIYNIVCEYGQQPTITKATATAGTLATVTINNTPVDEGTYKYVQVKVVPQSGEEGKKFYQVRYTNKPKQGVTLIKATHDGTATGATVTGYLGGTYDKNTASDGKLGGANTYFGIKLAEGNFQAGDVLYIHASTVSSAVRIYSDKGTTRINAEDGTFDANKMFTYTLTAETEWIYIYRKVKDGESDMNPYVDYIEVQRHMAPFIEEFKIGEAVGTIDKSAKTIAVEVPYSADLEHLTPTVKYWANGGGTITPAIGETDFSGVVNYTVSSAYAEDATGDYAPVTYAVTVSKAAHYEAKIGETGYATLVEAVAAAVDGDVVVLQENVAAGAGVMIAKADAKQITIDFGGYTYTANSPAVGSVGTQNQAFHFEKGCDITLKNGTIACSGSEIKMLIQNYGDLTLENITLDGTGLEGSHRYVMSNNCGDVVIGNGTTITAKAGDVAFDVCATNYYPEGVTVTVKDGASITGIVEYDVWGTKPAENKAELAIEGGNFNITWNVESALAEDAKENLNVSGGQFSEIVPADYCAEGYAPVTTPNAQGKYEVIAAGIIRGAATQDANNVYMYTLDNGVVIYASQSDGRLNTSNHISTSSDIEPCGGDHGGYNVNQSKFVLKFPVNVKEFTLYGANSTERTISKVYDNAEGSEEIKISTVGRELTGTYTNTKDGKCQTLTAVFDDENVIPANYYVLVTLSGTANVYRVLYTEAECTIPTVTVADQTAKENVEVTLTANATALGATYQWYQLNGENYELMPGKTAKTLTVTKVGEADQFYKVVVGCNCSEETAEDVAKVSLYTEVTTLVDVTGNTVWDWSTIVNDVDGAAISSDGKKVNGANGILANYIQGTSMDKIESNNGAYAIRSNSNQYYQGASLHMHTTKGGILKIHARNDGNTMTLNVQNAGRDIEIGSLGNWKDYTIYVQAGDVVIYNVPETEGKPMRIDQMTFTVKESPDYPRDVTNNIGTLCVDHNVVAGGALGATFYQIASRNETYPDKIDFEEVMPGEELKAGQPYIFKSNTGKIELYYGETVADGPVAVRGMHGVLTDGGSIAITEENKRNILYISQNDLYNCTNLTSLSLVKNRAYIVMSEVPTYAEYQASQSNSQSNNARRRVTLSMNGTNSATDIDNIFGNDTKAEKVLINGQLFILRGGKMFDATGRLVK